MFRQRLLIVLQIGIILFFTPVITDFHILNQSDPFQFCQNSDDIEIYIVSSGFMAHGMMTSPSEITHPIVVRISAPNNVSTVFADITDNQENRTFRVFGNQTEGNNTDGVWHIYASRFMSWEGGIFTISYTVWVCDALDNWSSAYGYQSLSMRGTSNLQYISIISISGSLIFLAFAIVVTGVRYYKYRTS